MQRLRSIIYGGLLIAWAAFAIWQYRNYQQQSDLIVTSMRQQSRSIMTALVGGLRSHRRLGQFFEEQLQGMLDELAKTADVIFVAIRSTDNSIYLSAGDAEQASSAPFNVDANSPPPAVGQRVERFGAGQFLLIEPFELNTSPAAPSWSGNGRGGGSSMGGGGMGRGGGGTGGGGTGGGRGWGSGIRRRDQEESLPGDSPSVVGQFEAKLLLDSRRAEVLQRHVAWSHGLATLAASLVALSIGMLWRTSINLAEAKGHTRVTETEMRHLHELGQAAAGLAHETRNPLGLIRGWTQRLAETDVPEPERQENSRAVIEECDRVTARINQFLAFARPREPDLQTINVPEMLEQLSMILQPDLESHQLRLEHQVTDHASQLHGDSEMLRQVLFNLLQNAIQFSPPGDTIEIVVDCPRLSQARIQIQDRGPGVADDAVESLFTPYFTTRSQGTGLGLAIVRHLVALHGWQVAYRKRDGGGAIFEIGNIDVAEPTNYPDR